jgi:hydroxymethylglutaryl-CoA lyase
MTVLALRVCFLDDRLLGAIESLVHERVAGALNGQDLASMLEAMGLDTGIDLQKLIAVRSILADMLADEPLYGFLLDAGLPLGFRPAQERVAT